MKSSTRNRAQQQKPGAEQLQAAWGKHVPDLIAKDLKVLFCGINPSLYSAAVGFHFARPGNRFWPVMHLAGFSSRLLHPSEGQELLKAGFGISNIVPEATARADELSPADYKRGFSLLGKKLIRYRPRIMAVLGIGAYREAFGQRDVVWGRQKGKKLLQTELWVLPNPSGLNAHFQIPKLVEMFAELRKAAEEEL